MEQPSVEEPSPALDFERATGENDSATLVCSVCSTAPAPTYFMAGGKVVCTNCRVAVESIGTQGTRLTRLARALALGGGGALVGSLVYGAILLATDSEFGLISIFVGYVVGLGVSRGSYHRGGLGYQLLAMALTYVSITSAFIPLLLREAEDRSGIELVFVSILSFFIALAMPFLRLAEEGAPALLSLAILGFGLHQAFRLNRRIVPEVLGPFDVPNHEAMEPANDVTDAPSANDLADAPAANDVTDAPAANDVDGEPLDADEKAASNA